MHELPIAQSILEIALRNASASGAKKVTGINLVIGRLATAVDDSIQFYWSMIAEGTLAEGAVLHFERIATEMRCFECGQTFEPEELTFSCPVCGSAHVRVSKGDELRVESIDIE
jgi:hydrogenase nickel incorporation protein HypA/HybF